MKTVIQDLNGNMLFYEEEKYDWQSNTFYSKDGKIITVTYQWEPDRLMRVEVVKGYNLGKSLYDNTNHIYLWQDLSSRFGTTLLEDLDVFRKKTIPNQACEVYIPEPVPDIHISLVKELYDTSNWIWP